MGIKEALKELGLSAEIEVTLVDSPEKARDYKFLGSPTIKINGLDLEAGRGDRPVAPTATENFSINACRTYIYEGALYHYPPKEMLLEVLKSLKERRGAS
ncbi:MAG: hypothetical protein A3E19_03495 [Planctomycetes bacterium RIFCSPHIGHO2_12_FULL_52_36]|nr:MAG: hypothetical protein A3D89_02430 [Planctomycetes bacterium RIFCSPHIGHO2_02_FULL_52_58]OHB93427.1 MAG: hypothetical protein A3E19_03495 [Planctomycetes bacterium RIFCSPHIGHO2_12_FULL_52_36]